MLKANEVRDAFKYLFPDELPALQSLVEMLPKNPLVINIGAGAGTSGLAIFETRRDLYLITIDITDESSPFGCLIAERDVFERAGYKDQYGVRWRQIHEDSVVVGMEWSNMNDRFNKDKFFMRLPNMVFVDGDHSYEHARDDIQIWLRNLAPGGILAVHDYLKDDIAPNPEGPHPQPWPGVDRAVQETLIGKYEQILHVDSLIAFKI